MDTGQVRSNQPLSDKEKVLAFCTPESEVAFSLAEFRERLQRIKARMAQAGIDTLFVSSPENMYYVSGFRANWYSAQGPRFWVGASGIAINVNADDYIHFERQHEQVVAKYTTVSRDIRVPTDRRALALKDFIIENLEQAGWLKGKVGLELWNCRPKPGYSREFQAALEAKGATVVDGTDIVNAVRRRKSPMELAYIRTAAGLGDIGMRAAKAAIRPGVTELDVYAEMTYAMAKAGGEVPAITPPVVSGPKCAATHSFASRRQIMPGDLINIDVCGVYNRYHSNLARSFSVGAPAKPVAERVAASARAFEVFAQHARPDARILTVMETMRDYYRDAGVWGNQRWIGGYELGIGFPPDWVGPFAYDLDIDLGDETFGAGTVVNFESQFYLPDAAGVSLLIDTAMFEEGRVSLLHTVERDLIIVE